MSTTVSVADLRKGLGHVLEKAHHDGPVMVKKRDRPYASVVSHDDGKLVTDLRQVAEEHHMEYEQLQAIVLEMVNKKLSDMNEGKVA